MPVSTLLAFDCCHDTYRWAYADSEGIPISDMAKMPSDELWRSHKPPTGQEFVADFAIACREGLAGPQNVSRLRLCDLYYLRLGEYETTRREMRVREDVWVSLTDDIRDKVGRVLLAKSMFPPRVYFNKGGRARQPLFTLTRSP